MITVVFVILYTKYSNLTSLKSILNQKNVDCKIFICTDNKNFINNLLANENILLSDKIFFIDYEKFNTYEKVLTIISSLFSPKYIVFHENSITSNENRLYEQYTYLESNKNLKYCSCLANTLNTSDSMSIETCNFENTFSTFYRIDEAFLGYYIPFSLSSLLIETNYLRLIMNYSLDDININDKVSFILYISRYSSVNKINNKLITYNSFSGYKNYCGKISSFNISKSIELRSYLMDSINDTSYRINFSATNSLSVLIILDKANLGGTEIYVYSLIKCLLIKGITVTLATNYGITYPIIKNLGVNFLNIDYDIDKSLTIITDFISKNKVDLIHCNLENSMLLGKVIKEKYHIPFVVTLHGTFYSHEILNDTCNCADAIISVSKPVDNLIKSLLTNTSNSKYYIVNNGISLDYNQNENIIEKLSLNDSSKLIIYCSRLGVGKGKLALNVINSLKDLLILNKDLHLIIIGEGFSKFEIQSEAAAFNDSIKRNAIICTGAIYNVKDYFSKASVVIGTGRVIIESLSVKTPSIAYGLEGLLGIITPNNRDEIIDYHFGDHGFIDLTENKSLIEMILYILDNKELFNSYSSSNYQWCANNFNEIINTNSIIDIYKFSLNKPPKYCP